jgi:murein DD-endopeptidase MepM/ murein hydrolase activator NlpD
MPLVPALCILFLVAMMVLSNRDRISFLMYRDVVPIGSLEDSEGRLNLISYAGISHADISARTLSHGLEFQDTLPFGIPGEGTLNNAFADDPIDEPMPLKMVEYFAWENYVVKRGDSVSKIAADHGLSYDAVIASNELTNAHLLRVGQTLRLPNMNGIPYVVKQGDNLFKISKNWNIPLEIIVDVNNLQQDLLIPGQNIFLPGARMQARDLRLAMGTSFAAPLKGMGARQTSGYGWRKDPFTGTQRLHEAIDWAIATGTPVRAASDGKVAMVGNDPGLGRYIILNHSDNYETLYAHLSIISVKQGDSIAQGAKIGEVGSTGRSTGSHLHFALYRNNRAVNPLDFITF